MDAEQSSSFRVTAACLLERIKHEPALRLFNDSVVFGHLNAFDRLPLCSRGG